MGSIKYHEILNKCWANNIFVRQVPIKQGKNPAVELHLEMNGMVVKKGEKQYKQNTFELEDKIEEIYSYIYQKQFD